jgi:hypothetical protein
MSGSSACTVELTEDEALVLFEYFERLDETGEIAFTHPSEYVALQRVAGQVCKGTSAMFKANYAELLAAARERVSQGFEGVVPSVRRTGEA